MQPNHGKDVLDYQSVSSGNPGVFVGAGSLGPSAGGDSWGEARTTVEEIY
jgi:hypothetical protein